MLIMKLSVFPKRGFITKFLIDIKNYPYNEVITNFDGSL